jgi:phosphoribosylanthranilate isomerase
MTRQIKICGLKTIQSIDVAVENGADMIGLVFFPPSPRNLTLQEAKPLADHGRGKIQIVALVVDADDDLLTRITVQISPDFFQAHGCETPARIAQIKELTGLPVIKAIKVRDRADVDRASDYQGIADTILFDAKAPDNTPGILPGGNGETFDWSLLTSANPPASFMLSGGLNPDNVAAAISATNAAIVDVSSGVETTPGQKDLTAIKKFIEATRAAG